MRRTTLPLRQATDRIPSSSSELLHTLSARSTYLPSAYLFSRSKKPSPLNFLLPAMFVIVPFLLSSDEWRTSARSVDTGDISCGSSSADDLIMSSPSGDCWILFWSLSSLSKVSLCISLVHHVGFFLARSAKSVSYTHLTLPTILRV